MDEQEARKAVEWAFGELGPRETATIDDRDRRIIERALPFTMTGVLRLQALVTAVRYLVSRDVPGGFAECGVWRGGSVLAMIETLRELGRSDRDLHLFDTFEGMTEPTELDTSPVDRPAREVWEETGGRPYAGFFDPQLTGEDAVRGRLLESGYPSERLHLVRGPVEKTLPERAPERLALLRLDTDWYESTRHELAHLYPRLERGGVLIVDDYGYWEGCRRAVDEYFTESADPVMLARIDFTGRIAVKT